MGWGRSGGVVGKEVRVCLVGWWGRRCVCVWWGGGEGACVGCASGGVVGKERVGVCVWCDCLIKNDFESFFATNKKGETTKQTTGKRKRKAKNG